MHSKNTRLLALENWLHAIGYEGDLRPIAGDASGRRFYRLTWRSEHIGYSLIAVDAPPPESVEQIQQARSYFIDGEHLVFPTIHALNIQQGFALMDDMGDQLLHDQLATNEAPLYKQALAGLIEMQTAQAPLPATYTELLLDREMNLFSEWLVSAYLKAQIEDKGLWTALKAQLVQAIQAQPQTRVHRDYHSRNLLLSKQRLGVVDFQDAVTGSYVYDVVSLLRDAYHETTALDDYLMYFYERSALAQAHSYAVFEEHFHTVCLQRQLKVAGIFVRLYLRDGKAAYLPHIPRVLNYLLYSARYFSHLKGLVQWIEALHQQVIEKQAMEGHA